MLELRRRGPARPGADPAVVSRQFNQFGGNDVVRRFTQDGQDDDAFDAHLTPGSAGAAVTAGQQVAAGDQVGALGNSGNSDAPHLHFHVMVGPNPLASNGLPYVFDPLTMVGRAASAAAIDEAAGAGAALPLAPAGRPGRAATGCPCGWMWSTSGRLSRRCRADPGRRRGGSRIARTGRPDPWPGSAARCGRRARR